MKRFYHSEFARHVLTLMSGTTISQVIPFLISPVISRIYTPEDMDILALFTGIVTLLAPAITGAYENAIMLPKEDDEAYTVGFLTGGLALAGSILVLPVVIFFNQPVAAALNNPDIAVWLYLVPLGMLLLGLYQVFTYWTMRKKCYRRLANSRIAQSLSTAAFNLGMGFARLGASGLVLGQVIGQGLALGILAIPVWKENKTIDPHINRDDLLEQARRYRDFPRYTLPQTFLDAAKDSGLVFLLSSFFVAGTLGSYAFALKILKAPLNFIGIAIGQVFYQKAAESYNAGKDLWPILRSVLIQLTLIAVPVILVMLIAGPELFAFIFGEKWYNAGVYARILSPWILIQFISSPVSQIPLILRKQKIFLFVGMGYDLIGPAAFAAAALLTNNVEMSLIAVSTVSSLYLVGIILWFIRLTRMEGKAK